MTTTTDPHARNVDEDRRGLPADSYHIGESEGDIVIAFCVPKLPCDVGIFLNHEEALEFLGRFVFELNAKGGVA